MPIGFEPMKNGFADRPLRPLGHSTKSLDYAKLTQLHLLSQEKRCSLSKEKAFDIHFRPAFGYFIHTPFLPEDDFTNKIDTRYIWY